MQSNNFIFDAVKIFHRYNSNIVVQNLAVTRVKRNNNFVSDAVKSNKYW